MYCHQCGAKQTVESNYCFNCGSKLIVDELETRIPGKHDKTPLEIDDISNLENDGEEPKRISTGLPWLFLIPLISLLITSGSVFAYYLFEKNTNEKVIDLVDTAEKNALNGEYESAIANLNKAIKLRPNNTLLTTNKAAIKEAISYSHSLGIVKEHIKKQELENAEKLLNELFSNLHKTKGPLIDSLLKQADETANSLAVGKIKQELNIINSIDDLAKKLTVVATLTTEEAIVVKDQISNKIIQVTNEQAEKALENKNFSEALATIDRGLHYSKDNKTLLAFKEKVIQEKQAFEKAEQERIQRAMEAAAKEDLLNRTAAVNIVDLQTYIDEYGDLYINGTVKNAATTTISSITVYYSIYDTNGYYIDQGSSTVYPYYLGPSEIGWFDDLFFYVQQDVTVEIDNVTWYLE